MVKLLNRNKLRNKETIAILTTQMQRKKVNNKMKAFLSLNFSENENKEQLKSSPEV